jgi:hypothetical protein
MNQSIIAPARRTSNDGALSVSQAKNARRLAQYVAKRQGIEAPLINIWRAT